MWTSRGIPLLRSTVSPPFFLITPRFNGCISAGETRVRGLYRQTGARLFGDGTAGASSTKRPWTFPSGIATRRLTLGRRDENPPYPAHRAALTDDSAARVAAVGINRPKGKRHA
jgi:hypothetical protein